MHEKNSAFPLLLKWHRYELHELKELTLTLLSNIEGSKMYTTEEPNPGHISQIDNPSSFYLGILSLKVYAYQLQNITDASTFNPPFYLFT